MYGGMYVFVCLCPSPPRASIYAGGRGKRQKHQLQTLWWAITDIHVWDLKDRVSMIIQLCGYNLTIANDCIYSGTLDQSYHCRPSILLNEHRVIHRGCYSPCLEVNITPQQPTIDNHNLSQSRDFLISSKNNLGAFQVEVSLSDHSWLTPLTLL